MKLDNFVFDSQFTFLNAGEKLEAAYAYMVLKKTEHMDFGKVQGFTRREYWDSEKMEQYIGRLVWLENKIDSKKTLKETVEELNEFDCCYIRLNSEHSFCKYAEEGGLKLLSSKATQHLDLGGVPLPFDESLNYIEYSNDLKNSRDIIQQVLKISESSFTHNRFRSDDHFSNELINDIYRSWVINEIKNKTSRLFLLMEKDKVASFFLYRDNISPLPDYKIGFVSLIATPEEFVGKKCAYNLFNYVREKARKSGTQYMIANTELGNISALEFFKKNQFKITAKLNEYHIWN